MGSSSSDSLVSGYVLVPIARFPGYSNSDTLAHQQTPYAVENLTVFVVVQNSGLQFSMESQGDVLFSMLINDPIPIRQLNSALLSAIRPHLATFGPWNAGYGLKFDNFQVDVQVSLGVDGINISAVTTSFSNTPTHSSTVVIEDITDVGLPDNNENDNGVPITESQTNLDMPIPPTANDLGVSTESSLATTYNEPSSLSAVSLMVADQNIASNSIVCRGKKIAPTSSIELCRSTRSNKYDGFHVPQPTDRRPYKSKVKPRVIPGAQATSATTQVTEDGDTAVPPPTHVPVMQVIGVQLCAVPEVELSDEALNRPLDGPSSLT